MRTVIRICSVLLLFTVAACMPKSQNTQPTFSTQVEEKTAISPTDARLKLEDLQNQEYYSPSLERRVKLINGVFSEGETTISLLPQTAIGDLNGDEIDDAAVLLAENSGGTGTFVYLETLVSQGNQKQQIGCFLIDDRPLIQSLTIVDNSVFLDATIHGINDAMVSPSLQIAQIFRLLENNLTLMKLTSKTSGGLSRSINIEAPLSGSEVSDMIQLKGSMTVAPFENNLRLSIIDLAGTVLYNDDFMVSSVEMGGPATFDNEIPLPTLTSGEWVRLELAELSMADGSVMDLDSVLVKIK